ncbi:MAG: hypothetical protein OXD43_03950 [Bacteroidetes bacterium]|nr:hypothetical protein [Bacteroidota bacterium]
MAKYKYEVETGTSYEADASFTSEHDPRTSLSGFIKDMLNECRSLGCDEQVFPLVERVGDDPEAWIGIKGVVIEPDSAGVRLRTTISLVYIGTSVRLRYGNWSGAD